MSDAPGSGEFGREWTHGVERRTARQNRPSRTWGWERDPISASRISQHEFKISARSTDRPAGMAECAEMWAAIWRNGRKFRPALRSGGDRKTVIRGGRRAKTGGSCPLLSSVLSVRTRVISRSASSWWPECHRRPDPDSPSAATVRRNLLCVSRCCCNSP